MIDKIKLKVIKLVVSLLIAITVFVDRRKKG